MVVPSHPISFSAFSWFSGLVSISLTKVSVLAGDLKKDSPDCGFAWAFSESGVDPYFHLHASAWEIKQIQTGGNPTWGLIRLLQADCAPNPIPKLAACCASSMVCILRNDSWLVSLYLNLPLKNTTFLNFLG